MSLSTLKSVYILLFPPIRRLPLILCWVFIFTSQLGKASPEFSAQVESRVRFEHLDGQFRTNPGSSDQALFNRTLAALSGNYQSLEATLELIDARDIANIADANTPLSTSTNNPTDILQINLAFNYIDFFCDGCELKLKAGRMTLNWGSRRLLARNRFRNTINAFTGLHGQWQNNVGSRWQFLYSSPVQRRVDGSPSENNPKLDEAISSTRLWGLAYQPKSTDFVKSEWILLGLQEQDTLATRTRGRELFTLNTVLESQKPLNSWFWQIELAYQWGRSRLNASSETLDHSAYFAHAHIGHPLKHGKLSALIDYASGDKNPNDGENNRFDTLFGARRFDFGPTSIYGPFSRANLITPGIRWQTQINTVNFSTTWRYFQLAERADNWSAVGVSPASVNESSTELGHQWEARWRWHDKTQTVHIDLGGAYLWAGDFLKSINRGDARFIYSSITYKF